MDQLAEGIGGKLRAEDARRRLLRSGTRNFVGPRPAGGAAIAAEGAAGRIEPGDAGNAPVARGGPLPRDAEARVAKRAALLEPARGLAVDTMLAAPGDPGDALPDKRAARRPLDPEQHAVRPGLPAKGLRIILRCRRRGGLKLPALTIGLDPVDQLANLGIAARLFGRRRGAAGHRTLDPEVAGPERLQRGLHLRQEILAIAQQRARGRPQARQQGEPCLQIQTGAGDERRGDCGHVLGEEGDQGRADLPARERLCGFAAHLRVDGRPRPA